MSTTIDDKLQELMKTMTPEKIRAVAMLMGLPVEEPKQPRAKKWQPVIAEKHPTTVHLTVHCKTCNTHYTVIKEIHDSDKFFYFTKQDGMQGRLQLKREAETWVDTYTMQCHHCERVVKGWSREELEVRFLQMARDRRFRDDVYTTSK